MLVEEVMAGEDHAWSADAALGPALFEEALLDGVEFFVNAQTFDGGDVGAFGLEDGDEARVDEIAVHDDGAGSALAFAAALFGSGKVKVLAEDVEKALHWRGFDGGWLAVDGELDLGHLMPPEWCLRKETVKTSVKMMKTILPTATN